MSIKILVHFSKFLIFCSTTNSIWTQKPFGMDEKDSRIRYDNVKVDTEDELSDLMQETDPFEESLSFQDLSDDGDESTATMSKLRRFKNKINTLHNKGKTVAVEFGYFAAEVLYFSFNLLFYTTYNRFFWEVLKASACAFMELFVFTVLTVCYVLIVIILNLNEAYEVYQKVKTEERLKSGARKGDGYKIGIFHMPWNQLRKIS